MNALGWQIGAVLFGASFFIVAIYLAKVLNSANKVVERTNRLIDVNERHITDIIDNASHITKSVREIMDIVTKISSLFRVFKFFKK
ncbi:DUF948 domain-containing protein [Terrisporobacter petrolearius]|uniref:DUF948 domain-containing protein n=1 Tax=Terrisporobacter petrolearius TaxID=1460447 RepID=UPI003B00EE6F